GGDRSPSIFIRPEWSQNGQPSLGTAAPFIGGFAGGSPAVSASSIFAPLPTRTALTVSASSLTGGSCSVSPARLRHFRAGGILRLKMRPETCPVPPPALPGCRKRCAANCRNWGYSRRQYCRSVEFFPTWRQPAIAWGHL